MKQPEARVGDIKIYHESCGGGLIVHGKVEVLEVVRTPTERTPWDGYAYRLKALEDLHFTEIGLEFTVWVADEHGGYRSWHFFNT